MISGLKSEDYEDRLKELGLTSLEERRHRADMALVHSVMHGHSDVNVDDWFQKADISARATRVTTGALNVRPRYGRLEVRKHSFTEAKIALEKDFMTITRDKNQANYKLKTKYERT